MRLISELWHDIGVYKGVDFTGKYEISSKGRLKSCARWIKDASGKEYFHKESIIAGYDNGYGYLARVLRNEGKQITIKFHRLVAEFFLVNPNGYKYVNHKDENKQNNDVNNLEWCTFQYNLNYGTRIETITRKNSIPVVQLDMDGNFIKEWRSMIEAGRNGFTYQCISKCIKGELSQHHGYKWVSLSDYNK